MGTEQCAYRSSDADVVAWFDGMKNNRWVAEVKEIAATHGLDTSSEDCMVLGWSDGSFGGFNYPGTDELPKGWRRERRTDAVVPDKRLAAGKSAAKALKDHGRRPTVRDIPGMAAEVWKSKGYDGRAGYTHTVVYPTAFLHEGTAYVMYDAPRKLVEDPDRTMSMGVPDERWEPIKLSEYHAALEEFSSERVS